MRYEAETFESAEFAIHDSQTIRASKDMDGLWLATNGTRWTDDQMAKTESWRPVVHGEARSIPYDTFRREFPTEFSREDANTIAAKLGRLGVEVEKPTNVDKLAEALRLMPLRRMPGLYRPTARYALLQQRIWESLGSSEKRNLWPLQLIPILRWLDEHPEELPKKQITAKRFQPLAGLMVHVEGQRPVRIEEYLDLEIVPDPEPTNGEKWERIYDEWINSEEFDGTFTEYLDHLGVKAP